MVETSLSSATAAPRGFHQHTSHYNINRRTNKAKMRIEEPASRRDKHQHGLGRAGRCPRWRHRPSGSRGATLPATGGGAVWFAWPTAGATAAAVLVTTLLSCLCPAAIGLVIEEPFQATFDHVAAAFGPDVLSAEPPVESRPLVRAKPRDGCVPLHNAMDEGAIALVERGTCNFTQKVLHAQLAGASAVVVTDTPATDKWLMVMYGDPENTQGIDIPAVLVSHATGERLWSNRSWLPGRQGRLRASVGAAGHIVMAARPVGALEMLGIYLLLSVLLLAFSGVCGLVFALGFTWYQRGYRTRAMRKLKSFTFRRRPPPPTLGNQSDPAGTSSSNSGRASGTVDATTGQASSLGNGTGSAASEDNSSSNDNGFMRREDDDLCAICLETYEDGDSLTGLPCRHSFHTQCIRPWLSGKSALCPMCKSEAFGKGGLFLATAPRLEAAFAELAALCTENLAVLGLFFLASVACGVIAAKLSLRE
ncbi:conserved unknown protein [Ectocarpus siliculosus]|uniref:RING-type domain-containing protein n=1 Tax=Ectocarpus siliculosus TaxID=2880 RepID=D8LL22_ECTSI|nr:conserved unknown protein [Ectocarpus siliculosus]|eukprot:CBN76116.1 conserved unknown protein [Ectocarpus siliculosus]